MNLSHDEAEKELAAIRRMTQKARHSFAISGAYIFLIVTGAVWLVGFLATQFLSGTIVAIIWVVISLLGTALSIPLGARLGPRVRGQAASETAKRAGLFWLFLTFLGASTIAVARPTDGKQITMMIVLFIMIGQLAMGLVLSFAATWWALPIAALALLGYFLLPAYFYLWMGILVGGGMILLGLYIRWRW
ncbi:MAG TPA: hypothetical protein PJ988_12405 [Anaerolinea sp.]|nr:hypothetical protein [Anaerolinea sp.]